MMILGTAPDRRNLIFVVHALSWYEKIAHEVEEITRLSSHTVL